MIQIAEFEHNNNNQILNSKFWFQLWILNKIISVDHMYIEDKKIILKAIHVKENMPKFCNSCNIIIHDPLLNWTRKGSLWFHSGYVLRVQQQNLYRFLEWGLWNYKSKGTISLFLFAYSTLGYLPDCDIKIC